MDTQDYYLKLQDSIYNNRQAMYKTLLLIGIYCNDKQTTEYASELYSSVSELYTYLVNINIKLSSYAKYRNMYVEKATISNNLVERIDEIDEELEELSQNFKTELEKFNQNIDKKLSQYKMLIWVLYKLDFHQKLRF